MSPKRKSAGEDSTTQAKKARPSTTATPSTPTAPTPSVKESPAIKDLSLDIPSHEKAFKAVYRQLKKSVRENWHDRYDDHNELQLELVTLLVAWQQEIFHCAILPGERLLEAYKAMVVVDEWIQKERGNEFNVRVDWREGDASWSVDDVEGKKVYEGLPENIQAKMWRDLLLKSFVTCEAATTVEIMKHCHIPATKNSPACFGGEEVGNLFAMTEEQLVKWRADREHDDAIGELLFQLSGRDESESERSVFEDENNENRSVDGYLIQDEWYAEDIEMQEARSRFKKLLRGL